MSDTKFDEGSLIGRKVGTYEIQGIIGHGGMGYVYKAMDLSLGRIVALKILKPELNKDKEFEHRFTREARALAELDHPNIVQVYSAGRFQDIIFIAMQLAPGRTLDQHIKDKGQLSIRESLLILRQVAQALAFAHKRNLMHRDIKPTNIMIDNQGRVKVMDFGLAKSVMALDGLTQNGIFYGTPEYGSPEQCETNRIDIRTDVYSLGVVFYEMLTGRLPFVAETPLALFKKISAEEPVSIRLLNPRVPRSVEALCARMMEKDREKRFQSADEVIEQINSLLRSTILARTERRHSASPWLVGAIGGILAAAIAAIAFIGMRPSGPDPIVGKPPAPDAHPIELKREVKVVMTDFENVSRQPQIEWYRVALTDMLITHLAQTPYLKLPTRDEMLWKLRESDPTLTSVSDAQQSKLIEEYSPNLYFTGSYVVQNGSIGISLKCYKREERTLRQVFSKRFERPELEFFKLIDEMGTTVMTELQRNAQTILAMEVPASDAIARLNTEELFFGGPRPANFENRKKEDAAEKSLAPAAAKAQGAWGGRRRLERSEEQKFAYSVQLACEQVGDRESCRQLKQQALAGEDEGLHAMNESLEKLSKPYRVRFACRKCGTDSACPGCPGASTVILSQAEKEK